MVDRVMKSQFKEEGTAIWRVFHFCDMFPRQPVQSRDVIEAFGSEISPGTLRKYLQRWRNFEPPVVEPMTVARSQQPSIPEFPTDPEELHDPITLQNIEGFITDAMLIARANSDAKALTTAAKCALDFLRFKYEIGDEPDAENTEEEDDLEEAIGQITDLFEEID